MKRVAPSLGKKSVLHYRCKPQQPLTSTRGRKENRGPVRYPLEPSGALNAVTEIPTECSYNFISLCHGLFLPLQFFCVDSKEYIMILKFKATLEEGGCWKLLKKWLDWSWWCSKLYSASRYSFQWDERRMRMRGMSVFHCEILTLKWFLGILKSYSTLCKMLCHIVLPGHYSTLWYQAVLMSFSRHINANRMLSCHKIKVTIIWHLYKSSSICARPRTDSIHFSELEKIYGHFSCGFFSS